MMFEFKRIESDSGLEFDHRWRRSVRIGAVTVFESVRIVAYPSEEAILIYCRFSALDEEYQKRLSRMGNYSITILMHLMTLMWLSLYVVLGKIFRKEYVIKNAEHDAKWHKKWPFAADQFTSVKRNEKLKQLGI